MLRDTDGLLIGEAFSTAPGDPPLQLGPNPRSADLTEILLPYEGRDVILSLESQDISLYFNVSVDDVSLVFEHGFDCQAPSAHAGTGQTRECSSPGGANVDLDGSGSQDADSAAGSNDDIVLFEWFEGYGLPAQSFLGAEQTLTVTLPVGSHRIALRVTDSVGEFDVDEMTVHVVDTVRPQSECTLDRLAPIAGMLAQTGSGRVKQRFEVATSANDACGSVAVQAWLVPIAPLATNDEFDSCEAFPVADGDEVDLLCDVSACEVEGTSVRAGGLGLVVTAKDRHGNEATCRVRVACDHAGVGSVERPARKGAAAGVRR